MKSIDTVDAYWHDIHNTKPLGEEAERALALRIRKGDENAIGELVTANLKYVMTIARKYSEKGEVSMDDLISEGNMAMLVAAGKWDPDKEPRFVNYAMHDINKAMEAALPQQGPMITMPKKGGAAGEVRRLSTDDPVHPGQTNTLGDMLKAGKPMTDDAAEENEVSYALAVAVGRLNDREREVITSFYAVGTEDHLTMSEIGEKMNLKRERVRQIRKTAERKLRRILKQL